MNPKVFCYIFFLFVLSGIYCCNGNNTALRLNADNQNDTVLHDIPKNSNGKESNVFKFVTQMAHKLKIERLDTGFKQTQIRIWCSYSFIDSSQLVVLKKVNNEWSAQLYTYFFKRFNDFNGVDTIVSKQPSLIPQSGWRKFLKSLRKLKIEELPDMDRLNNTFIISEGDAITVEIATINKYRLYSYVNPKEFENKWWQAKNMENILVLIEYELNFKRIR